MCAEDLDLGCSVGTRGEVAKVAEEIILFYSLGNGESLIRFLLR